MGSVVKSLFSLNIVKHCFLSSTWSALDGIHIYPLNSSNMTVVTSVDVHVPQGEKNKKEQQ